MGWTNGKTTITGIAVCCADSVGADRAYSIRPDTQTSGAEPGKVRRRQTRRAASGNYGRRGVFEKLCEASSRRSRNSTRSQSQGAGPFDNARNKPGDQALPPRPQAEVKECLGQSWTQTS